MNTTHFKHNETQRVRRLMHFLTLVAFATLSVGCGTNSKEMTESKFHGENQSRNEPTSSSRNPNDVQVTVGADQNVIEYLFDWRTIWNNRRGIDIPPCGKDVPDYCKKDNLSDEQVEACKQHTLDVQSENLRNGFYYEEVSNDKICNEKCNQKMPSCSGLGCVGSALSFAGKKILEKTQLCRAGCGEAIAAGVVIPVQCKNFKDSPEWQQAAAAAEASINATLNQSPEFKEKSAQLASLETELKMLKQREEYLKNGSIKELEIHVNEVFNPGLNKISDEIQKAEFELVRETDIAQREVLDVLETTNAVLRTLQNEVVTSAKVTELISSLKNVEAKSCKSYRVKFYSNKVEAQRANLYRLTDDLITVTKRVENEKLTGLMQELVSQVKTEIDPYKAPEEIVSGQVVTYSCSSYRYAKRLSQFALFQAQGNSVSTDLAILFKKVNEAINASDNVTKNAEFSALVAQQAAALASELSKARIANQIQKAQGLAVEAYKALYLVIVPTIELHPSLNATVKEQLSKSVEDVVIRQIKAWHDTVNNLGLKDVALARAATIRERLNSLKAKVADRQVLKDRWNALLRSSGSRLRNSFDFPLSGTPQDDAQALQWDTEMNQLERALYSMEISFGGQP